ncbi:hypothetical protein HDU83_008534 [Entophlyctis luteolus]|nr:hypothetical protein HDU82_001202 [Entophlyctis luteolus]KAJ3351901.1 hypothetical protein HDU83_008534 [Entophlyctis luteolus]KAJ3392248.1 hypothetical protein HDU84_004513 [Entophlyctis sp. JEL0112]
MSNSVLVVWTVVPDTAFGRIFIAATAVGLVRLHAEAKVGDLDRAAEELSHYHNVRLMPLDSRANRGCKEDEEAPEGLDAACVVLEMTAARLRSFSSNLEAFTPAQSATTTEDDLACVPVDFAFLAQGRGATLLRLAVWRALREVPRGSVWDYSKVAKRVSRPSAVRAVASAIAANPVPLVVPCHRVVGRDGTMRGFSFAGGVAVKRRLLRMETGRMFVK